MEEAQSNRGSINIHENLSFSLPSMGISDDYHATYSNGIPLNCINSHNNHANLQLSPDDNCTLEKKLNLQNSILHVTNNVIPSNNLLTNAVKVESDAKRSFAGKIHSAYFEKQPPNNLRKSNFFHFNLIFLDESQIPQQIDRAVFVGFCEENMEDLKLKNGIVYNIRFRQKNNETYEEKVLIRLIDSSSKKPISYDGQDKNPDMCRVLLTHEIMCSRCCENKSCGNRNETPSDPVILSSKISCRFHMKCNQNCLKNAGNPRETRRFQVMVCLMKNRHADGNNDSDDGSRQILATSDNMFVHNNSKHGRRPSSVGENVNGINGVYRNNIFINLVIPKEGKVMGYEEVAIVGDNFYEGLQIIFGNQIAYHTEVISPYLIKAITPAVGLAGSVEIRCTYSNKTVNLASTSYFKYRNDASPQIECYLEKLWILLPKQSTEFELPSQEAILKRTCEFMELIYNSSSNTALRTTRSQTLPQSSKEIINSGINSEGIFLPNSNSNFNGYEMNNLDEALKNGFMTNTPQQQIATENQKIVSQLVNSLPINSPNLMQGKNKCYYLRKRPTTSNSSNGNSKCGSEHQKIANSIYNQEIITNMQNNPSVNLPAKNGYCNQHSGINNFFNLSNCVETPNTVPNYSDPMFMSVRNNINDGQEQFSNIMDKSGYQEQQSNYSDECLKRQANFEDNGSLNYYMGQPNGEQNFNMKQFVNNFSSENRQCNTNNTALPNISNHTYSVPNIRNISNTFGNFDTTSSRM